MKVIEQRYFKQFNALDTLLAGMNNTASALDGWLKQNDQN
jgi:flagellar capping protein FliD